MKVLQTEHTRVSLLQFLTTRALPDGGFAPTVRIRRSRPDATAWAALAFAVGAPEKAAPLEAARSNLARFQRQDGSVCLRNTEPIASWPTSLALLAWHRAPRFADARARASAFLLRSTGIHYKKPSTSPMGHDTSLRGWPWNPGTHSWVEPTALSLLALDLEGYGNHERCREATRMLLDRRLSSGGWNYGNTVVYGTELRPLPAETGMALTALDGRVEEHTLADSVAYLERELTGIRTPLTLAWGILGLSGWNRRPLESGAYLQESVRRQETGSPYTTAELSLLMLADRARRGLRAALRPLKEAH